VTVMVIDLIKFFFIHHFMLESHFADLVTNVS
jgi:hypothetical protein